MSRRFLVPPTLPSGTSNPASGFVGDLFFRTDEEKIYVYTATGWVIASGGGLSDLDGGSANTTYLATQAVDGGNASDF
jgi:hypothetical protein